MSRATFHRRRIFGWLRIYLLYYSGLLKWAKSRIAASSGIVVLTLHRVLPPSDSLAMNSPAGMVVGQHSFDSLLGYLDSNCDIFAVNGSTPCWEHHSHRTRVAITFDDGWLDTAEVAGPLALKHRIPLTVFVCPGLTGQISPFWPERIIATWRLAETSDRLSQAYSVVCADVFGHHVQFRPGSTGNVEELINKVKKLSGEARQLFVQNLSDLMSESPEYPGMEATMNWQVILNWAEHGNHVGAHGDRHEILTNLDAERARHEIDRSKHQIEINLNQQCDTFAYPNGSWSHEIKRLVIQAGFQQAFINSPGVWTAQTDRWLIPRVNIWEGSLAGVTGKFSAAVFEYTVFWRSYIKLLRNA